LSTIKYQPHIDGLRAIAVVLVVLFHGFPRVFSGGFVGVDLFFVISGFLITKILLQDLQSKKFSVLDFYARRIRRIFPALLLLFAFAYALGWFVLLSDEYAQLGKHILGGVTFTSNWILWLEAGYFDKASELKPFLHLWSLGIEEQFYLLWPIFLYVLVRSKSNISHGIIGLIALSFIANFFLLYSDPVGDFYLPISRFWELAFGGILACNELQVKQFVNDRPQEVKVISIVAIALLAISVIFLDQKSPFPGWLALLPVTTAFLMILVGDRSAILTPILCNRWLVSIGLISYPLYLWHWVLFSFARIMMGAELSPYIVILIIALAVLLSFLTYFFVEKNIRNRGKKSVMVLLFLMIAVGIAGWNVYQREGLDFRYKKMIELPQDFKRDFVKWEDKDMQPEGDCEPAFYFPKRRICLKSEPNKLADTVVIGDSHAYSAYWGIRNSFGPIGHNVQLIGKGACVPYLDLEMSSVAPECATLINSQLQWVVNNKTVKNVFIVHRYAYLSENSTQKDISDFKEGLHKTLTLLASRNKKVIYILSLPELRFDPKFCVGDLPFGRNKPVNDCSYLLSEELVRHGAYRMAVQQVLSNHPEVMTYDPSSFMCNDGVCHPVVENKMVLMDDNHLSESGSIIQGEDLYRKITLNK
jgi:peptidoglycan/LPS O-acetylase OafA/YrhL